MQVPGGNVCTYTHTYIHTYIQVGPGSNPMLRGCKAKGCDCLGEDFVARQGR